MAHAYTPGLRVRGHTTLRKTRRLPLSGELAARAGRVIRLGKGRVVSDAPPVRPERFGAAPVSGR